MPRRLEFDDGIINESINEVVPALTTKSAPVLGAEVPIETPGIRPATDTPIDRRFTFGTPINAEPTFGDKFKSFSEEHNLPTALAGLAHAIGPETAGGRFGKFLVGQQAEKGKAEEREEERAIKRLGVESQVGARTAAEETRTATLGIREDANKRAKAEATRQKDLGIVYEELAKAEPGTIEHDVALNKLRIIATPGELVQLGLITKPITGAPLVSELPGRPDQFGYFDRNTGEFITRKQGAVGIRGPQIPGEVPISAPTPGQLVPGFSPPVAIEGPGGTTQLGISQTRGVGPGAGKITTTGVTAAPKSDLERKKSFALESFKARNIPNPSEEDLAEWIQTNYPTSGKKSSIFTPPGVKPPKVKTDQGKVITKKDKDMVQVMNPSGVKGRIPRANLSKALDAGFTEVK